MFLLRDRFLNYTLYAFFIAQKSVSDTSLFGLKPDRNYDWEL